MYIYIYIYKVTYIHPFFLFFSTGIIFLHCMLNILKYEKKLFETDQWIASWLHPSSDVIFWMPIVNPFSLLCSILFLSRKLCFLQSPCLLLITESISLDTSGKTTVRFFLKISSSSWIILSISLNELNSNDWLLKRWWIFLK